MKKFIMFAALTLTATLAVAEGGKIMQSNKVFDEYGSPIGFIVKVDDACRVVVDQSGNDVIVICDEEN